MTRDLQPPFEGDEAKLERRIQVFSALAGSLWALSLLFLFGVPIFLFLGPPEVGGSVGEQFLLSVLGGTLVAAVCAPFAQRAGTEASAARRSLLQIQASHDERPPILLLRSISDAVLAHEPDYFAHGGGVHGGGYMLRNGSAWLATLGELAHGQAVVIGEDGSTRSYFDNGVLVIDTGNETWFEVFEAVARAAQLIVTVPSVTPGLLRELEALERFGLLSRTAFLMPALPPASILVSQMNPEAIGEAWEEARQLLKGRRLELPPYSPEGAVFQVGPDGEVATLLTLGDGYVDALEELCQPAPVATRSLRAVLTELGLVGEVG